MSESQERDKAVGYWQELAVESLAAAKDELKAGRQRIAINRIYYSAFYAACAALLRHGHQFTKHSSVRAAVNREFVGTDKIPADLGAFYNAAFDERGEGDYEVFTEFDAAHVKRRVEECELFLAAMARLSASGEAS